VTKAENNEAFVREYQARRGLHVDGWAGPEVRKDLDKWSPPQAVRSKSLKYPPSFFAVVRDHFKSLTGDQVVGIETLLKAMKDWPVPWVAYALATADIETAHTFQPVREAYWLSEDWRKKNLRYYPHYGRGYVQLTWPANYAKADAELNLGGALVADLDKAMDPYIAADVMVRGMEEGWFTGKKLADYLPSDYVNARRIINGTDKARQIAAVAVMFEKALNAGEWS
jgi:putative chitinase